MRYLGAIVWILLFAAVAAAVLSGVAGPFDATVRDAIHGFASAGLTGLARVLSLIGENIAWAPAALLAMAALWLTARKKQAAAFAIAMLGAIVLENGLKLAFHRIRPEPFFGSLPETYSFPSGHALFAACFYGALALIIAAEIKDATLRTAIWIVALLFVLGIGLSRIYLGVHYPSDVLAGYFVGAGWLATLRGARLFRFPRPRSRPQLAGPRDV